MQTLSTALTVRLGDQEFDLRPSLKAATAVSNRFGGFQNALAAVGAADLAAIQFIIRQGVPLKAISTEELNEAVWSEGTIKAMTPAGQYITRLANGGRDQAEEDGGDDRASGDAEGNGEV